jgi:hypothetical protein
MTSTATLSAPTLAASRQAGRTARLDQVRAAAKARGSSAQVVTLTADERAETVVEGYAS